jgi:hypothetical protein
MRFYIPASDKYVQFDNFGGIVGWNVLDSKDNLYSIKLQNGTSDLEVHELIGLGQIIEVHRQIQKGQREYDSYAIFSEALKKAHQHG